MPQRPTTSPPFSLSQTLIDDIELEFIPTQIIPEGTIGNSDLFQVFDHALSLGLCPGFSEDGRLVALAIADDKTCRIIEFITPPLNKQTKTEAQLSKDVLANREMLQEKIFCRPSGGLFAFDMGPLVMAIHKFLRLRVTNAIDIQSSFPHIDRRPISAIKEALGDSVKINSENVAIVFLHHVYGEDLPSKTDLAMRAWISQFLSTFRDGMMIFEKAKKINTKDLKDSVISMISKVAIDSVRLDQMKPIHQVHRVSQSVITTTPTDNIKLNSLDYATHVRRDEREYQVTAATDTGNVIFSGTVAAASGRDVDITPTDGVVLSERVVMQVTSIGREDPTTAEAKRAAVVLRVLQGELHLLHGSPWIQNIWFVSDTSLTWPAIWSTNLPRRTQPRVPTSQSTSIPPRTPNTSQRRAVNTMLSQTDDHRLTIIQGPPGTGKTTVISVFVQKSIHQDHKGIWLVAKSNVAVRNIAEKLMKDMFFDWKLLVSEDFRRDWHEQLYGDMRSHIIPSNRFKAVSPSDLKDTQVILCTLDMLANSRIKKFTSVIPLCTLVVDEASQIEIGEYIPIFTTFDTLRKVCFIGDDKQLPPYGQENLGDLQSIFEVEHLTKQIIFLDTQYRMPPQIGDIISEAVYEGKLKSNDKHLITSEITACHFINVANGTEKNMNPSFRNDPECQAILKLASKLQARGESYRIITPYDAQTTHIAESLKQAGLDWGGKCFNVDSFQGNEDDFIIISVVRSRSIGFLDNLRRTNVMLTRCKRGMFIFSSQKFLTGPGAETLVGTLLKKMGNAWISERELEEMDL